MRSLLLVAFALALAGCSADDTDGGLGDAAGRGDGPGEMGSEPAPDPVAGGLGAGAPAEAGNLTQASEDHACALLEDGQVKCWGANDAGQLGTDPPTDP